MVARGTTGTPRARAAVISTLSGGTAVDTTTTSAPSMLPAAWPRCTRAPSACKRSAAALAPRSEPDTV